MTKSLSKSLEYVLADTYALYLKTQNYHWNVEGCHFRELHSMFEEQYNDLFKAIDDTAEIIRALGYKVIGTFDEFMKNTKIKNGNEKIDAETMVKDLVQDQSIIEKTLKSAFAEAQKVEDEVVASFLTDRMAIHRKNAWLMKSSLCQ